MGGMKDLFGDTPYESVYPPRRKQTDPPQGLARNTDPETSHIAPEHIGIRELQRMVLTICALLGRFTDLDLHYRCCEAYGERKESTYRKRRTELANEKIGYVEWTGDRVEQEGSSRRIWRITDSGREANQKFNGVAV
jgi:hypothetical protein